MWSYLLWSLSFYGGQNYDAASNYDDGTRRSHCSVSPSTTKWLLILILYAGAQFVVPLFQDGMGKVEVSLVWKLVLSSHYKSFWFCHDKPKISTLQGTSEEGTAELVASLAEAAKKSNPNKWICYQGGSEIF